MSNIHKANCWESMGCGREPGGARVSEMGVCPAATATWVDGVNNGQNAGRICWAISGTLCNDGVQGSFTQKMPECGNCAFYARVKNDEGHSFIFVNRKALAKH